MSTIDPQHVSNSTPPHNTLLVNGAGQTHTDNPLAHLQDLSPSDEIDYLVSRIERGYGPHVLRFDRHAYLVAKQFYVLVDDVELVEPALLTWNFHAVQHASLEAGTSARIRNGEVELTIQPFGSGRLVSRTALEHVLPRVQFDTAAPVPRLRAGWLLPVGRVGAARADVTAEMDASEVRIRSGAQRWTLPVISRRASFRSDIMLAFERNPPKSRNTDLE